MLNKPKGVVSAMEYQAKVAEYEGDTAKLDEYKERNQTFVDHDFDNEHIKKFIECNKYRLNQITTEAVDYIKNISFKFGINILNSIWYEKV